MAFFALVSNLSSRHVMRLRVISERNQHVTESINQRYSAGAGSSSDYSISQRQSLQLFRTPTQPYCSLHRIYSVRKGLSLGKARITGVTVTRVRSCIIQGFSLGLACRSLGFNDLGRIHNTGRRSSATLSILLATDGSSSSLSVPSFVGSVATTLELHAFVSDPVGFLIGHVNKFNGRLVHCRFTRRPQTNGHQSFKLTIVSCSLQQIYFANGKLKGSVVVVVVVTAWPPRFHCGFSNQGRRQVDKVTHRHVGIVHATSFALVAAVGKLLLQQALQGNQWFNYLICCSCTCWHAVIAFVVLIIAIVGSNYWQLSVRCWVEPQDTPVLPPKGSVSIDSHSKRFTRATRILEALENGSIYGCCIVSTVSIAAIFWLNIQKGIEQISVGWPPKEARIAQLGTGACNILPNLFAVIGWDHADCQMMKLLLDWLLLIPIVIIDAVRVADVVVGDATGKVSLITAVVPSRLGGR